MKNYIFLTVGIHNMGGTEMYTSNKVRYLKSKGWNVIVFYFLKGNKILLPNLVEYEGNYIPYLQYAYYYFNRQQRTTIINKILECLQPGEIVVESHLKALTYWAELIAEKTGAKSILNCLEENISQITKNEAKFFEYKVYRNEVLNGSPGAYKRYFGRFYKQAYDEFHNKMIPYCSNVVSYDNDFNLNLSNADFNLLSIGRLDKPYIENMLLGLKNFVKSYSEFSYNLIFIGGSQNGKVELHITEMFNELKNVSVYLLGYMMPIPYNLIKNTNVAMATSNSVLVTSNLSIPTISYSIHDYQPIGIYGITTTNRLHRVNEPVIPTELLLKEILIDGKYNDIRIKNEETKNIEDIFNPQIEFLNKSPNDHRSYDVMKIHSKFEIFIGNFKRILLQNIGVWPKWYI